MDNPNADEDQAEEFKLLSIFMPVTAKGVQEAKTNGTRFVHYTTAAVATSILKKPEIWLRNTSTMNDFMEVDHGLSCLQAVYGDSGLRNRFASVLNKCRDGLNQEIITLFNEWVPTLKTETYSISVSEHPPSEDEYGRLSMWRAYGGKNGVALVLNGDVMFADTDALGAYAYRVHYASPSDLVRCFGDRLTQMENNIEYLVSLDKDRLKGHVFRMLCSIAHCTKHPGFREEREWRIISIPQMHRSELRQAEVEVIRGTPQVVLKLPLKDVPSEQLVGLTLPKLLNRIIIGPCEFPVVTFNALLSLMKKADIPDAEKKIIFSDIPLRNTQE